MQRFSYMRGLGLCWLGGLRLLRFLLRMEMKILCRLIGAWRNGRIEVG
jgi:hypothetical protein